MKRILISVVLLTIMAVIGFVLYSKMYRGGSADTIGTAIDHKNAVYVIEGEQIELENGYSEKEIAPGSAAKKITKYFGNDLVVDLNNDGKDDVVFLVTQENASSGIFYYVVAALNTDSGYVGSEALFLGDRVAPQTIEKGEGKIIVVNYADRASDEPYTTPPSIGKSLWLLLDTDTMQFGQVEQNFEGEADPNVMQLNMKTWGWISTTKGDGEIFVPNNAVAFSITFEEEGQFSATTDCNSTGGSYAVDGQNLTFSNIFSTKMFCENSDESDFVAFLMDVSSYQFTSKGELLLTLKDGGEMAFR